MLRTKDNLHSPISYFRVDSKETSSHFWAFPQQGASATTAVVCSSLSLFPASSLLCRNQPNQNEWESNHQNTGNRTGGKITNRGLKTFGHQRRGDIWSWISQNSNCVLLWPAGSHIELSFNAQCLWNSLLLRARRNIPTAVVEVNWHSNWKCTIALTQEIQAQGRWQISGAQRLNTVSSGPLDTVLRRVLHSSVPRLVPFLHTGGGQTDCKWWRCTFDEPRKCFCTADMCSELSMGHKHGEIPRTNCQYPHTNYVFLKPLLVAFSHLRVFFLQRENQDLGLQSFRCKIAHTKVMAFVFGFTSVHTCEKKTILPARKI